MEKILRLSFCVLLSTLLVQAQTQTSVIQTGSGPVQGIISTTIENVKYAAFKGIPFAKPPVGNLRFKPPVQIDPWTNVLNASTDGSVCIQYNPSTNSATGSEDCLYLNVFTPHTEFNKSISKPVMVWIYGGGFTIGFSNQSFYGPDFILGEDVILVSFNYRLSALGFLNLEHENATGNCALKDQSFALRWVKNNIAKFGGNPNNITIFGQSAGAASVDLQVLSDMSKGLFSQSIAMSGSTLCLYWGFQTGAEAVDQAFRLGAGLGTVTRDKNVLLKALHNATAARIISAAYKLGLIPFRPTLEKANLAPNEEKFLTECSVKKYISGDYNKGPHMLGFTSNETLSVVGSVEDLINITQSALQAIANITSFIPFLSNLNLTTRVPNLTKQFLYPLINQTTDLFFIAGIDTKQKFISHNNNYPIYYYRFSFDSNYSAHKANGIDLDGVGHADDVPYIFYMPVAKLPLDQPDITLTRQRYVKLYTNFAKYGNPTPDGDNDVVLGITWPDSRPNGDILDIGANLTIAPRPADKAVRSLQSSGLGASPVLNDCDNSSLLSVIVKFLEVLRLIG